MSCVNINSQEYKSLVSGLGKRETLIARATISKFMTENGRMPTFTEMKSAISDLYNPNQGVDYSNFYGEAKKIFKQLIPSLTDQDLEKRVQFLDKLEIMRLRDGLPVLSTFINNTVYLSKTLPQERGTKAYTDVRHEVFHMIFNNFLNEKEQIAIIDSFKRDNPNYENEQNKEVLEEAMADLFESYKSNKRSLPQLIRDFFNSILAFFQLSETAYVSLNKLFDDVNRGRFSRNFIKDSLVTRDKSIINKHPRFRDNPSRFLAAKAFMLNNLNELMFPTDNKALSEGESEILFLKEDYTSQLFQNNKDVFKLGLTKEKAISILQDRLRALRGNNVTDLQLAEVVADLNDPVIFKDMFDYLQPYSTAQVGRGGELSLVKTAEEDPTLGNEIDDAYNNPMNLEIGSKELINPTTKISEVVKDFLSSVTYPTTQGSVVNIDPGAGFIALLNLMGSMYGNSSVEDNMKTITENYNQTTKGNQTKAVYEKLIKLHRNLQNSDKLSLNIKGVSEAEINSITAQLQAVGIKYEVNKGNLNMVIPANMYIENKGTNSADNSVVFEFNRFKEGLDSHQITQRNGENNRDFISRISKQTGIPTFVVSKLFQYNEDRNTVAEITKVAGSLRKLSPKFVRVQTERVFDQEEGESFESTSFAFIDKVSDYKTSGSLGSTLRNRLDIPSVRREVMSSIGRYADIKNSNNAEAAKRLLKSILVDQLKVILEGDFNRIDSKNIDVLLKAFQRLSNNVAEMSTEVSSEDFSDSSGFLKVTGAIAKNIVRYTTESNAPTSFTTSTSGKSKYENQMKNTSYAIFKSLQNFHFRVGKLKPFLQESFNNYLRYSPVFIHNSNTQNKTVNTDFIKITDDDFYADHQETYFENRGSTYTKQPVPFSKETMRDWINRNFIAMFQIPILEEQSQTKRGGFSYFQQKAQPESAPNVSIVKMGIQTAEALRTNMKMMIIQEAHLNYLHSTSSRGNMKKNTAKSVLAGLEGTTYFLDENKVNKFFDAGGNLNSKYGSEINGEFKVNESNSELNKLVDTMLANLDQSLDAFTTLAINERATLSGQDLITMYDKIKDSYPEKYKLTTQDREALQSVSIDAKTDVKAYKNEERFAEQFQAIKKVFGAYYMNSYVNGHFMNQLSSGATQNYKNPLDEVKRQAGVNAMNDTGLVDNKHGMKENYRNVVISSSHNFYGQSHRFSGIPVLKRFFLNKKNEVADAQSWDLPEYKTMLRKSFGKSVDMGVITKDVHFEVNERGETDYRKTSSAELTNEIVRDNKTLRDLRFALTFQSYLDSLSAEERARIEPRVTQLYNKLIDNNGLTDLNEYFEYRDILQAAEDGNHIIHKASFESAIKGSKPSNMSSFTKDKATGTFKFNLSGDSILTLNSTYNGIQQNVRHRAIDSFISHFTQLTYLIGLNRTETSIKNSKTITRTLSKFAKAGIFDSLFDYRMSYGEDKLLKVNGLSKKKFREDMLKKLDLPGNERLSDFLNTPDVPMNNPLFSEKLMQSFFNSLTKKTVTPKHPGGKFVLQSEFGFESNKLLTENNFKIPELVTEGKNVLYAECYLPEMYSDQLKAGEMIYYSNDEYNKMFGFRIPSSDLHSSVPLKVIGFYPTPTVNGVQTQDNVVIIPSAITSLHGSDFDVDSLFVVRYGVFGVSEEENDQDPGQEYRTRFQENNITIGQKGVKFGYTVKDAQYNEKGQITSFGNNEHTPIFNVESTLLAEKDSTMKRILDLEAQQMAIPKSTNPREKKDNGLKHQRLQREIDSLNKHLKVVKNIQKGVYSNTVLDAVLDNINYSGQNADDLLFGITFDPVKGYDETSEYSELARVLSTLNKEFKLPERPKLYTNLQDAMDNSRSIYDDIVDELENNLGVDTSTKEGQEDILALINEELKDNWVKARDKFIGDVTGASNVNVNKVEQHVTLHKNTYMASDLVGLIANFSKGLAYAFHGITDDANHIKLDLNEDDIIEIDGIKINKLVIENKDGIKNQELKSLVLNAAIDHVKEQILNVLNVGEKTAKIFLAAISTEMNMHQATMLMLQPVAKELNTSNSIKPAKTFAAQKEEIAEKLGGNLEGLKELKVTTEKLEKNILKSYEDIIDNGSKEDLLLQYKVVEQLRMLESIGTEVSDLSKNLSIIQGLPYNLEMAYDKLASMNRFIDVNKFFEKLQFTEKSEYTQDKFKDDLRSQKNLFLNVNLSNNENILGALEAIKVQIDVASEIFSENSLQIQFVINNILRGISNNSNPQTMLDDAPNLTFDTTKQMSIQEKYLKGKDTYNMTKTIAKNIFNYLTTGLNIAYNNGEHLLSLGIQDQKLAYIADINAYLGPVKSFINQFLLDENEASVENGDKFLISQINPSWRLKPLSLIKKENPENRFLRNMGIDFNFRDKIKMLSFNNNLVNSEENRADIEASIRELGNLRNIYVTEKDGEWVNLPDNEHPITPEMNEIIFNIIKTSLYTDKLKFSSNKVTNVIPTDYFNRIFRSLDIMMRDLLYYHKGNDGNKFYKNFQDDSIQSDQSSKINDIKENLFINTIFSVSSLLPDIRGKYKFDNKNAGILSNGNVYDFYVDATKLDPVNINEDENVVTPDEKNIENTNQEVEEDVTETQVNQDLFNKFQKNPSFLVESIYKDKKRTGKYDIYMKVGETGSKETNDQKYYYKKIGVTDDKISNTSFDTNLLLNEYRIKDYYNPKRLAIPVKGIDLNQQNITLDNITISNFLINNEDKGTNIARFDAERKAAIQEQLQALREDPTNAGKTDAQLIKGIKGKINVENVISQVKEVSLYDSRNIDRVGLRTFKVKSYRISTDRSKITYELEALPSSNQITLNKFDTPFAPQAEFEKSKLTREEKIAYVNSISGASRISVGEEITDADLNDRVNRASEIESLLEIEKVLEEKNKCE